MGLQGLWEFSNSTRHPGERSSQLLPFQAACQGDPECPDGGKADGRREGGRERRKERKGEGGRTERKKDSVQISHRSGNKGYVRSCLMWVKLTVRPSWSARSRQNMERVAHRLCTLPRQQPHPDSPSRGRWCVSGKRKRAQAELRIPSPTAGQKTVPLSPETHALPSCPPRLAPATM